MIFFRLPVIKGKIKILRKSVLIGFKKKKNQLSKQLKALKIKGGKNSQICNLLPKLKIFNDSYSDREKGVRTNC